MPFSLEISAVGARGMDGTIAIFDITENRHRHHILDQSIVPAGIDAATRAVAEANIRSLLEGLGLVGVLALEMFVMPDGAVIANEIAPRPHNSGHWTMDACQVSQFDQHIRAVAGLPVLPPRRHADVVMQNLVGPEGAALWASALADPAAVPHWYGKAEVRPGRKLGHVNRLAALNAGVLPQSQA
jgi:5-(carboxyamino)imidazole ribonucleotide synthase